jgi:hypothetical protein
LKRCGVRQRCSPAVGFSSAFGDGSVMLIHKIDATADASMQTPQNSANDMSPALERASRATSLGRTSSDFDRELSRVLSRRRAASNRAQDECARQCLHGVCSLFSGRVRRLRASFVGRTVDGSACIVCRARDECAHEQLPRLASNEKQSNWRHVLGAKYKMVYRAVENQEHVGVPTQGG